MKPSALFWLCVLVLAGCSDSNVPTTGETAETRQPHLKPIDMANKKFVQQQAIYVPVYSHIYYEDPSKSVDLAVTLSVRNTDAKNAIIVTSVNYYGTDGKLLKEYLNDEILLEPMATADFVVARTDSTGGAGANFVVNWVAEHQVSEPIAEAVMISAGSGRELSFVSRGVPIEAAEMATPKSAQKPSVAPAVKPKPQP